MSQSVIGTCQDIATVETKDPLQDLSAGGSGRLKDELEQKRHEYGTVG